MAWKSNSADQVRSRNQQVLERVAQGESYSRIAEEFNVSPSMIYSIKRNHKRDQVRRKVWGELSSRTVKILEKMLGFHSLSDLYANPMTEEEWGMVKGAGWKLIQELKEKTSLFKKPVQPKVALALYAPETYERLLQEADDAHELDQTWKEWKARTDRLKKDMRDLGVHLHEVKLDLSDLREFCRHYHLTNTAQTRSRYVTEVSTNKEWFEWRKA